MDPLLEGEEEHLLWSTPEADCYKVLPAHSSSEGVYSGSWGAENFLATVEVEILVQGDKCRLHLKLPNGDTFAEVIIEPPFETAIVECLDSSRYMVLTITDRAHPGRKQPIGMGFTERPVAFDFKTLLKDHLRRVEFRRDNKTVATSPVDYSIKEGQKISLNMGGKKKKSKKLKSYDSKDLLVLPSFTPTVANDPFSATAEANTVFPNSGDFGTDPFGSNSSADPFATAAADPFATAVANPFTTAAADPFAPLTGSDPFVSGAADPFAGSDPFGASDEKFGDSASPFNAQASPFDVQSSPFDAEPASNAEAAPMAEQFEELSIET